MNEQKIEIIAIYYHDGTPENNCTNCNYFEDPPHNRCYCARHSLPTKRNKTCGEHVTNVHPTERIKREEQNTSLFE